MKNNLEGEISKFFIESYEWAHVWMYISLINEISEINELWLTPWNLNKTEYFKKFILTNRAEILQKHLVDLT